MLIILALTPDQFDLILSALEEIVEITESVDELEMADDIVDMMLGELYNNVPTV